MNWQATRLTPQVSEVRMKYKAGFEQSFLLTSDVHFDNPKCDRDLYFRHMDAAKETNSGVFCFGDFFCMMGGKYDPRRSKKGVRPEHNVNNYIDAVINDAAEQLAPYSKNLILFSDGNHETGIIKNLETDPLERFTGILNASNEAKLIHGRYQGFVRFRFTHESGGKTKTVLLYFHHGKWGGVVSKGTQSIARFASFVPQADIIVSGHTHDTWNAPEPQIRVKESGEVYLFEQEHIKTATYKEEFLAGEGWATERIVKPKPLGGYWLHFYYELGEIKFKLERAKK